MGLLYHPLVGVRKLFHYLADNVMNEWTVDVDRRIYKGIQVGMDRGFVKVGDPVVIVTGWKPGSGSTNTMRIINATELSDKDQLAPITGKLYIDLIIQWRIQNSTWGVFSRPKGRVGRVREGIM